MKFEHLQQSIALNETEDPSIINTLCMVRSLFQDVEIASGLSLSQCAIGEGQLQQELIRVSNKLISIYEDNSDALQRNRVRLDAVMEQLQSAQAELEKLAGAEKLLPEKEAELKKLEEKIAAARAAHAAYADILRKLEAAQKELAGLQGFDFDSAEARLLELHKAIEDLQNRIRSLDSSIQEKTGEKNLLQGDVNTRTADLEALRQELEKLTREKQELEEKLREARAEHETLTRTIAAARDELERLNKLIADTKQTLADLQNQIDALTIEKNQLEEKVAQLRKAIADLNADIANLNHELAQVLLPELNRLTEKKRKLLLQKQQTQQQIIDLTGETAALDTELTQLQQELPQRIRERDEAKARVDEYRQTEYDPVTEELDTLLRTEAELQKQKATAEQQITELKSKHRTLVQEIAQHKDQYEQDSRDYEQKQEEMQQLLQEQEDLTVEWNRLVDDLALRQAEFNKLRDETLPATKKSLTAETERRDKLQEEVDGICAECQKHTAEILRITKDLPNKKAELQGKQCRYEALRATYTSQNQDILDMEQKIEALTKQNDQERLDAYRLQLQAEQQRLTNLEHDCEELDAEILDLAQKVETAEKNYQILEGQKHTKEEGLKQIGDLLEKLQPFDTPESRRDVKKIMDQLATLQAVRDSLAVSIAQAYQCIVGPCLDPAKVTVKELEVYLYHASDYSASVYDQLAECAKTLKEYTREEPK